jgi:hypothetical protein
VRIHEVFGGPERKPQEKADTITEEEIECADRLYAKYQSYLLALGTDTPLNPLLKKEMDFLIYVINSLALHGNGLRLPIKSDGPSRSRT